MLRRGGAGEAGGGMGAGGIPGVAARRLCSINFRNPTLPVHLPRDNVPRFCLMPLRVLSLYLIAGSTTSASGSDAGSAIPSLVLPRILPLGDSITFGCGSTALPPNWTVGCTADCGGYRSHLYHMLRDTGWSDANGTALFQFVGSGGVAGPSDIPMAQRAHEGHPGWTINK